MNKKEFDLLKREWYKKLRTDGFKDIESVSSGLLSHYNTSIGHNPSITLYDQYIQHIDYYSVLSDWAYYNITCPTEYSHILIHYCTNGSLEQACLAFHNLRTESSVRKYIKRNWTNMLRFYNDRAE